MRLRDGTFGGVIRLSAKIVLPPRAEMKRSMEAIIEQFKLYTEDGSHDGRSCR
jgi:hypothetical protein